MKNTKRVVSRPAAKAATGDRALVPGCKDPTAFSAFVMWRSNPTSEAVGSIVDFAEELALAKAERAVVEHVSARVSVPKGTHVRFRMFTSLGYSAGNIDLIAAYQGCIHGKDVHVVSHSMRAYTDRMLQVVCEADDAGASEDLLVCVSGYIAAK